MKTLLKLHNARTPSQEQHYYEDRAPTARGNKGKNAKAKLPTPTWKGSSKQFFVIKTASDLPARERAGNKKT